jgi:PAS domain S-box-containing protein
MPLPPRQALLPRSLVRPLLPLASGLLTVVAALFLRHALPPALGEAIGFPLYLLAVMAAAWLGGIAAALLAAIGGLLLVHDLAVLRPAPEDLAALSLALATALAVSVLSVRLKSAIVLLRGERARYRSILHSVGEMLLVIDAGGRLEFFNREAREALGLDHAALGRPLAEVMPLRHANGQPFDPASAVGAGPHRLPDDLEAARPGQPLLPVAGSIAAVGRRDSERGGYVLSLQDVSALRSSHLQLQRSEAKLRALFESELLAIFTVDLDGRMQSANPAFLAMLGYTEHEVAELPALLRDITPPEFWPSDLDALAELIGRGGCRPYEKAFLRRDGSRVWVTVGGAVVQDDSAAFFAIDSQARSEADARVSESRKLLQSIIDSIPAFVAYIDADGNYRVGNRYHIGDMAPSVGLLDQPIAEVFDRERYHKLAGHLRRALVGTPGRTSLTVAGDGGQQRHYSVQFEPRRSEDGRSVEGVVLHAFEITDQLQRQRELLASEVRFRRLAEASAAIVCHVDHRGSILYLSGWRRFTGDSRENDRLAELLAQAHPADQFPLRRFLVRCRRAGVTVETEFRLRHASGGYHHIAVRAVPIGGGRDQPPQWMGSARDVHDKRSALLKLRRAEEELRLILDTMPARIAYIEVDSTFRWANRAFAESFDLTGDLRGAKIWQVFSTVDRVALGDAIQRGFNGFPSQVEWLQEHRLFGARWSITSITPDIGPDGKVAGCITLCTDHTERKRTEQALRRSNREHRALAESVPHMVWIAYGDGRMFYFNQRWRDYTGLSSVDAWQKAIMQDDRSAALGAFRSAVASGAELSIEVRLLRARDGEARWHTLRAVPVADENGKVARWYGTCTDIEDQKQAQATLQRAQERTQQFLATLSHELRNPLAALMTSAHLLNREELPEAARPQLAQTIRRQTVQLQRLIEDLLDISRITQGKVQLQLEEVALNTIVADVGEDFAARAAAHGVEIVCSLPEQPLKVRGDPARLRQIVDNLTSNALKATPPGGRIELSLSSDGGRQLLRVVDTGAGIPEGLFARMFEPFVQGNEWRDRGLGLGLAVVARMTALHGGEVHARNNRPAAGATFEVSLPALDAVSTRVAEPAAPLPQALPERGHGGWVLVVDDEVDHAEALKLLLELHGFEVATAHEGQQALDEVSRRSPDAVICDLGMPEPWSGYQLGERLRADFGPELLLLAFSGYGTASDVERALAAGFDGHLLKPSTASQVLAALQEGLRGKRESVSAG